MSKCFKSTRTNITTSGERTDAYRQSSIYKTTAVNSNSSNYISNDNAYNVKNGCFIAANSYSGFLDLVKGKHLNNPILDGASAGTSQMWEGNFIKVDLSGITHSLVSGFNIEINLENSNTQKFPSPIFTEGWGDSAELYPGHIIDPSGVGLLACDKNGNVPVYFNKFGKVTYRESQEYWDAITKGFVWNGMSFPSRVILKQQETNLSTSIAQKYAPQASYDNNNPNDQYNKWCSQ